MKNTFGTSVCVTLFGESHGPAVGAVLDGLAPGIPVDEDFLRSQLALRRPDGVRATSRIEPDRFELLSGVRRGKTAGTPLCILIRNEDARPSDYAETTGLARPGHADLTAFAKYHGFADFSGGGHFSGRLTAALVAVGAVALTALRGRGIAVGTHILRCGGVSDRAFSPLAPELDRIENKPFAVLDEEAGERMRKAIDAAAEAGDSVGGVLETAVTGLPAGIGEPWFDTLEGLLAHALLSIPGIKGVEFGGGFALSELRASEANDGLSMAGGAVRAVTNHSGGIDGGISNGMPLLLRCAVKPTPTIAKPQKTVDLLRGTDAVIASSGRHDPAIVHRARVVADSLTALTLCDALALRFGTDWLGGGTWNTD